MSAGISMSTEGKRLTMLLTDWLTVCLPVCLSDWLSDWWIKTTELQVSERLMCTPPEFRWTHKVMFLSSSCALMFILTFFHLNLLCWLKLRLGCRSWWIFLGFYSTTNGFFDLFFIIRSVTEALKVGGEGDCFSDGKYSIYSSYSRGMLVIYSVR